jgi:DNA-binding NtrC family response regulator
MPKLSVLIAEDEDTHFRDLEKLIREVSPQGLEIDVSSAVEAYEAIELYKKRRKAGTPFDLVFVDLVKFPPADAGGGSLVVQKVFETEKDRPFTKVVLMSAFDPEYEKAGSVLQLGIVNDFLDKPLIGNKIRFRVRRIIEKILLEQDLRRQVRLLRADIDSRYRFVGSLSNDDYYQEIRNLAEENRSPVLIQGETGTGKEVIARHIHKLSARGNGPFVAVNCSAIPQALFEREFFGHEKGSFTDAKARRAGYFEQANGGILFLDEIGDLTPELQGKLLRAIENRAVRRIGGDRDIDVDVRVIAATHKDLKEAANNGLFRSDLFFRLNVLRIDIPPLSKRQQDIEIIAKDFLEHYRGAVPTCRAETISRAAIAQLKNYAWPGNVRELQNAIERACFRCKGTEIQLEDFSDDIKESNKPTSGRTIGWKFTGDGIYKGMSFDREIDKLQLMVIRHAEEKNWKPADIQKALGIANLSQHIRLRLERHLGELESEVPDLVEYFAETRQAISKLRASGSKSNE